MRGRKRNGKALVFTTCHAPVPAMSWIVAHQKYVPQVLWYHLADLPLYSEFPVTQLPFWPFFHDIHRTGKRKKIPFDRTADANKCLRFGQPGMGGTLPSFCFSAVSVFSYVYEMHISLFRISKLLHPLLLWLTIPRWNSLTRLSSSAFVQRVIHLYTGTSSSPDGICIHDNLLLPVTYSKNESLMFTDQ